MSANSAFFENASVTLVILLSNVVGTLWKGGASRTQFDLEAIMAGQLSRLFWSKLIFDNMGQVFVSVLLLYSCSRPLERQLGSRKFGAFVCVCFVLATLLEVAVTTVLFSLQTRKVAIENGPYFLLFALLPMFYWYVPKLYGQQATILSLPLSIVWSEKSYVYLLALQLCAYRGMATLIPCGIGLLCGLAYTSKTFSSLQDIRLPTRVENSLAFVGNFLTSLIPTAQTQPGQQQRRRQGGAGGGGTAMRLVDPWEGAPGGGGFGGGGAAGWNAPAGDTNNNFNNPGQIPLNYVAPPSEADINTLMGMGFEREAVIQALRNCDNNVEAAANTLLR